ELEAVRAFAAERLAHRGTFRVRLPRFYADPWCLRSKRNRPVADAGHGVELARRDGRALRYRAKKLAQYRNSGLFSASELELLEQRTHEASLESWARRNGVTLQEAQEKLDELSRRARRAGLSTVVNLQPAP